jgi:hypothetical protein
MPNTVGLTHQERAFIESGNIHHIDERVNIVEARLKDRNEHQRDSFNQRFHAVRYAPYRNRGIGYYIDRAIEPIYSRLVNFCGAINRSYSSASNFYSQ